MSRTISLRSMDRPSFCLVMCLALLASWTAAGCAPSNEFKAPPPPEVDVALPLVRDVSIYAEETGTTEAVQQVEIMARVQGILEEVRFEPNDDVKAGDILFIIEKAKYQAEYDLAEADLKLREVAENKAKIEYDRQKTLFEKKATPETNLVAAKAEYDGSQAEIEAAKARRDEAKLNLEYTEVRSPISGTVGKTMVKQGNLVTSSPASHLTTVVSYDEIYANFSVSERAFLKFIDLQSSEEREKSKDEVVPLYLARATDDGFPFYGTFNYADLAVDQSTGTYAVRGKFANPDRKILPGLFVRIRVKTGDLKDALLIPERATGFDQAGTYVLIVNDENKVERRDIEPGNKFGSMIVVLNGLKAEDRVIIDGVQMSRPNAIVNPGKPIELTIDDSLLNPQVPEPPKSDSKDSQPEQPTPTQPESTS